MRDRLLAAIRTSCWGIFCIAATLGLPGDAVAGGGPENVLLVVNRNSPASLAIANHYVALRQIPPRNVLTLSWNPKLDQTDVDTFREKILAPIQTAIQRRQIDRQIDYIVYSCDFPWAIDVKPDIDKYVNAPLMAGGPPSAQPAKPRPWNKILTPVASINGLTYLREQVAVGDLRYFHLDANRYCRERLGKENLLPTIGFRHSLEFDPEGNPVPTNGRRFTLSMMLAVTADRGNTFPEAINYLRRSATADGTKPDGTIYLVKNPSDKDRSGPRDGKFEAVVKELGTLGVAAEIPKGKYPLRKSDVLGVMAGVKQFRWDASGSTILPGAICDHLTSFGGVMNRTKNHTTLAEFLRHGAAGACGTVTEPYNTWTKFPTAWMHVHYARGCTLAEAFYQSVSGPYQLLIVGDPLCRPWANIPEVSVAGVKSGETIKGPLSLKPTAVMPGDSKVERFELFVDGLRSVACDAGGTLELDTAQLGDGYHELRIVAIEAGPIQSQGRLILDVSTANHGRTIEASTVPAKTVAAGQKLILTAKSPGSTRIDVLHNSRLIGRIRGEEGRLSIPPAALGIGPIRLRVVGLGQAGPSDYVRAKPLEFTVTAK